MQIDKRETISKLNRLLEMQKQCERFYGLRKWNTMSELTEFLNRAKAFLCCAKPTEMWFHEEEEGDVLEMIDMTQTKVEDSMKAKKRILKVWNENIFQPHNARFVQEYVEKINSGFRYFSTQFWKHKKNLRALFIEEDYLFTDEEIKILKKNMEILEESDNWLFFQQKKIQQALGEVYEGKETDFGVLRRTYDMFSSFCFEYAVGNNKFIWGRYEEFKEWIMELEKQSLDELKKECISRIPELTEDILGEWEIKKLVREYKTSVKKISLTKDLYQYYDLEEWRLGSEERRNIETVSQEELEKSILAIIHREEEVTQENIERIIVKMLQYKRRTKKLEEAISESVKSLKNSNRIKRFSSGWRLMKED